MSKRKLLVVLSRATIFNAERRRLPMMKVEKPYFFEGRHGKRTLKELF